jgi:hypothetical protein
MKNRNREILGRVLRANPAYELVLYDRLEPAVREALADLRKDPDFYGVLRPRDAAGLGVKSVDRETALLFLTLGEPGPLPSYVHRVAGESVGRVVAQLVADSILEVDGGDAFVSGPSAFDLLRGEVSGERERGRLAALSVEALRYAQALDVSDPLRLSVRLYGYNRRPLTPAWKRLLPSGEAVERHLGIALGGENRKLLRSWSRVGPSNGWLSWRSRAAEAGGTGVTYKLYVSPAPEALADSFGRVLEALALAHAPQFKIGADAVGLLRPDKIVAYFPTFERLALAADAIAGHLDGTPAQGVPFTSEIGGDGLLSWGMDPPAEESLALWDGRESWRFWLTHRLARAILAGKAAGSAGEGVEPWRFALERLRLEGVDTDSWTPGALLWRES